VRLAEERDVPALLQLLQSLSPQSLYYRFHSLPALSASDVRALIGVDGKATTLIAESGGRILAFASYHPQLAEPHRAEVSFAVSDAVQGHGIGTRLLEQLAKVARAAGTPARTWRSTARKNRCSADPCSSGRSDDILLV
jgi:N-acetylglutamate synthase-like GNAT family acetyltransferase